jgi:UDP-glucuronate 4-epimerase
MAIHKFAGLIQEGMEIPIYGDGSSRRDYTYVDDIIAGVVSALRVNPQFEIINLGESRTTTLIELITRLEEALGKRAIRRFLPEQPGDMRITYANISRAREILGYQPTTPIEDGIRRFTTWFLRER